ncbi:hypothetical protein M0805_003827 [Coniferiporia weirii]|nr:hypothetical protein M0805_003827 [Coniferiporia weirii]
MRSLLKLPPVKRLPPEIIRNIFLESLPAGPEDPSILKSPMNVSHTCRDWRDIALSYGILWSRLKIIYYGQESTIKEALDTWLQRSHGSPLYYEVATQIDEDYIAKQIDKDRTRSAAYLTANGIIFSMLQHQKCWGNIGLHMFDMEMSPDLQSLGALDMPMLTSLDWMFSPEDKRLRMPIDISSSRHLKKLRLSGTFELNVGSALIPSLTESYINICGNSTDMETCLALLQVTPNLMKFGGYFDEKEKTEVQVIPADPMLALSQLRNVYFKGDDFGSPILGRLTLPGLESLRLTTEDEKVGPLFSRFVPRSFPPLIFLEIVGDGVEEESLISALQHLPTLQELRLASSESCSEGILIRLTIDGNFDDGAYVDVQLCPILR